jgi:hypothetical protein
MKTKKQTEINITILVTPEDRDTFALYTMSGEGIAPCYDLVLDDAMEHLRRELKSSEEFDR